MAPLRTLAAAAAIAVGLAAVADSAYARPGGGGGHRGGHHGGHHHHGGVGFWGGGFWGPGWGWGGWGPGWGWSGWGPGWGGWGWGPSTVVIAQPTIMQEPRVWVEGDLASATPPAPVAANPNPNAQQWWYWCGSARKYYPYVASCTEGWQRVAPQPTAPSPQ